MGQTCALACGHVDDRLGEPTSQAMMAAIAVDPRSQRESWQGGGGGEKVATPGHLVVAPNHSPSLRVESVWPAHTRDAGVERCACDSSHYAWLQHRFSLSPHLFLKVLYENQEIKNLQRK